MTVGIYEVMLAGIGVLGALLAIWKRNADTLARYQKGSERQSEEIRQEIRSDLLAGRTREEHLQEVVNVMQSEIIDLNIRVARMEGKEEAYHSTITKQAAELKGAHEANGKVTQERDKALALHEKLEDENRRLEDVIKTKDKVILVITEERDETKAQLVTANNARAAMLEELMKLRMQVASVGTLKPSAQEPGESNEPKSEAMNAQPAPDTER